MAYSQQAEQIFAKVFGRAPESQDERSFLASAAQRKQGAALQGALEYAQQKGTFAGSQQQASTNPGAAQQGDPAADVSESALDAAQKSLIEANKRIQQANMRIFKKEAQVELQQQLLKNPAIQKLLQSEKKTDSAVSNFSSGITASELARPTQQGDVQGQDLASAAALSGDIGRSFVARGQGISQIISDIAAAREQELQGAVTEQSSASNLINQLIGISGEKRAQELFPLQKQKAELDITTERLQQDKIRADIDAIQNGGSLTPSERLAYSKALGVPPNQVEAAIAAGINPVDVENQSAVTAAQIKLDPRLRTIKDAIPRIEEAVKKVNTTDSYIGQIKKYGPFAAARGKDPDIAELETFKALRSSLARLTGEVGNLSEGEQQAVADSFIPLWTDSKQKAEQKLIAIKNFMTVLSMSSNPEVVAKDAANTDPNSIIEQYSGTTVSDEIDQFLDSF